MKKFGILPCALLRVTILLSITGTIGLSFSLSPLDCDQGDASAGVLLRAGTGHGDTVFQCRILALRVESVSGMLHSMRGR